MHILFLQNYPDSPAGILWEEAQALGARCTLLKTHESPDEAAAEVPTTMTGYDGLVVLGGAMSVMEAGDHPFVSATQSLIGHCDQVNKPVLGICLGSQLLADHYGGAVRRLDAVQFGFLPVSFHSQTQNDPLFHGISDTVHFMAWHQDTFSVPDGAAHLASREPALGQVIRVGEFQWGIQFHLETTPDTIRDWAALRATELGVDSTSFVQAVEQDIATHYAGQESFTRQLMGRWLELCGAKNKRH